MVINETLREREKLLRPFIDKYSQAFDIDPNLVRSIITVESRFVANATSPTGAYGYGQFTNIAVRQVHNIATMTPLARDLSNFTKTQAADPDRGVKALCATLWWLFYVKYKNVDNKRLRLEACVTFYNAGGFAADLVIKHGGHQNAIPFIAQLPKNKQSQAVSYTPGVLAWYVQWHELLPPSGPREEVGTRPIENKEGDVLSSYKALIEALKLLKNNEVDVIIETRDGLTEVSIIIPGEYQSD